MCLKSQSFEVKYELKLEHTQGEGMCLKSQSFEGKYELKLELTQGEGMCVSKAKVLK